MRSFALALLLAALLVTWVNLRAAGLDPLLAAPASVAVGIAAALAVQGGVNWLAVAVGAVSALASGWLESWSPWLALGALCLLWLVPRALLARTRADLAVASGAALGAAVLASVVVTRYTGAPLVMHLASCVFAGAALAMAALVGRTDSPLVHAVRASAGAARPPVDALLARVMTLLQAEPAGRAPGAKPVSARSVRNILKLADQLIASQALDGEPAVRGARLEQLRKAVGELESAALSQTPVSAPTQPTEPAPSEPKSGDPATSQHTDLPRTAQESDEQEQVPSAARG
jgi:hypothetical protein